MEKTAPYFPVKGVSEPGDHNLGDFSKPGDRIWQWEKSIM